MDTGGHTAAAVPIRDIPQDADAVAVVAPDAAPAPSLLPAEVFIKV